MPEISLLLPTRRRVPALRRMLRSVLETSLHPHRLEVVLGVDLDDVETRAFEFAGLSVRKVVGPRCQLGQAYRRCWNAAQADWVMLAGDQLVFESFGWDSAVRKAAAGIPDGVAQLCGREADGVRPSHLFLAHELEDLVEGLGIDSYHTGYVTAHVQDVFRQLAGVGHDRCIRLNDVRIGFISDGLGEDPPRDVEADQRTYIAWSEERRLLARDLAACIERAAAQQALRAWQARAA